MVVDVAIIGGGVAGLLAAAILTRQDYQIALLGRPAAPSPQALHVHTLPRSTWTRLADFARDLVDFGGEFSGRVGLDASLEQLWEALVDVTRPGRYRSASVQGDGWSMHGAEAVIEARWLMDCSGTARATARAVGHALGEALVVDEAKAATRYASWALASSIAEPGEVLLRYRSKEKSAGLLVACDGVSRLRFSLQTDAGGDDVADVDMLHSLLREAGASRIFEEMVNSCQIEGPDVWPHVNVSFVDMKAVHSAGIPWLAVGDALLTSPPSLGWGLTLLAEQLTVLDRLAAERQLPDLQLALAQLGQSRFQQAILGSQLRM